jgi:riboflavin kinase/FMN adenylyltransferase
VAVGVFDGVHLGHREVIRGNDTVLTFDPHPMWVINPEAAPKLLDTAAIKRDLIASLGVSELVVIPFDHEFAQLAAEDFATEILVRKLQANTVSVGENFRFGRKAQGSPELLRARAEFETNVVPLVEVCGETVSSSHIRGLVSAGEVDTAQKFLGRPHMLEGVVVAGDRRGHELGVPTANIHPADWLVCPGHGVYAALVLDPDDVAPQRGAPAAVSIGVRPTFDTGRALLVEVYLLDFSGDLYGKTLRVAFLKRLRGERRFDTAAELVEQMHRDIDEARAICSATVSAQ